MTPEQAQQGLKALEQIRNHPDAVNLSPESIAKLGAKEKEYTGVIAQYRAVSHDRNLARAGQEDKAGEANYNETNMRHPDPYEAGNPNGDEVMPNFGYEASQAFGRQMAGTGAATAELVPGLVHAVEGVGLNLKKRGIQTALPQPGDTERYVAGSPSPFAARGHAMVGAYLLGRGMLGGGPQAVTNAALKPLDVAFQGGKSLVRRVLPNSTVLANVGGGATAGLEAGLVNAGVTRAAQAMAPGEEVQPLTVGELAIPTLAGGALGALPGLAEWVTNPATRGGRVAQRYVNAKNSGTMDQVKAEERDVPIAGSEPPNPKDRAVNEFDNAIEGAAVENEGKFSQNHADAEENWTKNVYGPEYEALLAKGQTVSPVSTIAKLNDLVQRHASQSANKPGDGLLPLGQHIQELRNKFESYLGQGATLRDYKNAIDQASALAQQNRTSKVAERAYADVEKVLRDDAYRAFDGFAELSKRHEQFQTNHERETKLVYGKESHEAEDYAGKQKQGREFFKKATDESPAAATDSNELASSSPYGQEAVENMRGAKQDASTKFGEREAIELSKVRGLRGFGMPAAMALAHPSPYTAARMGVEGTLSLPRLIQPLRSRAATVTPNQDALKLSVPLLLQGTTQFDAARERIARTSQELVDAARGHSAQSR